MGNDTYPILYLKINLNSFSFKVVPSFVCCSTLVCLNFGDSVFVDCHNSVGIYDSMIKQVFYRLYNYYAYNSVVFLERRFVYQK